MNTLRFFLTRWGLTIVGFAGLMWLLGSSAGWYHTLRVRAHVRNTQDAIAALQSERDALIASIAACTPLTRERIAREQLQLGRDNEIVYRLNPF